MSDARQGGGNEQRVRYRSHRVQSFLAPQSHCKERALVPPGASPSSLRTHSFGPTSPGTARSSILASWIP